jgi:hypothetical protein
MNGNRRHDEDAYESLRTLEALTKTDLTVRRMYGLLRLLTRVRREAPELWEGLRKFCEEHREAT